MTTNPSEATHGLRYNQGKAPISLLSPYALEGLSYVLDFGAKKYAPWNWVKGMPVATILDSLLRHALAIQRGEILDKESGLPHIDHLGCNWMFLSHYYHTGLWDELSKGMMPPTKEVENYNGKTNT